MNKLEDERGITDILSIIIVVSHNTIGYSCDCLPNLSIRVIYRKRMNPI